MKKYINEIIEYQKILFMQLERKEDTKKAEETTNIDCWLDNNAFCEWEKEDFETYIKHLEKLTGITNKLGI